MLTRWVLGSLVTWIDWWPIRGHGEELVSPVSDVNYKLKETHRNATDRSLFIGDVSSMVKPTAVRW